MTGEIGILNVGAGDTKLSFDPSNPDEVKRACAVVKDMLRRGFALLVEVGRDDKGPLYRRCLDFDAETAEYIIAGAPDDLEIPDVKKPEKRARQGRKATGGGAAITRVPASRTSGVAVARTAGG